MYAKDSNARNSVAWWRAVRQLIHSTLSIDNPLRNQSSHPFLLLSLSSKHVGSIFESTNFWFQPQLLCWQSPPKNKTKEISWSCKCKGIGTAKAWWHRGTMADAAEVWRSSTKCRPRVSFWRTGRRGSGGTRRVGGCVFLLDTKDAILC